MIEGIDVSEHQGRIDWQRVKADGIGFVLIKATLEVPGWALACEKKLRAARAAGPGVR